MAVGRGGTAIAWLFEGRDTRDLAFAAGPAGHPLERRNVVVRVKESVDLDFEWLWAELGKGDRPQFTWLTTERVPGDSSRRRQRIWSSRGGPHGGAVGPPKQVYSVLTEYPETLYDSFVHLLTDARGGQVMAHRAPGGHMALLEREPGGRFHDRVLTRKASFVVDMAATNPAGDAVFAGHASDPAYDDWAVDPDVFALHLTRDGRVTGPVNLTPGQVKVDDDYPVAAIDDSGRAAVAWISADDVNTGDPEDVNVSMTGGDGRFRGARVVSPKHNGSYPAFVAASPDGHVAVSWTGNGLFVARGHTPR
ncbi:MAG TPA: hypothetical protein VJT75_16180 [Thermoleophilaceae bacterium]|nr:hypothetical protein [Thermoleophilaceae bacterium]